MIYFDNSATTKPYSEVLESYITVTREFFGNPSSLHNFGGQAEQLLNRAREQIATIAGVKPNEIIFTSGGTEGNNLATKGIAFKYRERGNHIITTQVEHPSISNAMKQLENLGFRVTWLPVSSSGQVDPDELESHITDETILVSMIHVNNEVGAIQPIEEIGKRLTKYPKVIFHVDHVQGVGKVPLDLEKAHVDLCTVSAHKFHGLKGTGFLYKRQGIQLEPLLAGGNQEQKLRSGTENTGGIVAMAKAFRMMMEDVEKKQSSLYKMRDFIMDELKNHPHYIVHTPKNAAPHIINFTVKGIKGEVLVHALEENGIIVSTTSACSSKDRKPSKTLMAMGVSEEEALEAIRVSLSYENTMEEAQKFVAILHDTVKRLHMVVRREK